MKTLKQTIIVILAISLLAAGVVPAKNVSDEEIQAVELQIKQAELEQQSRAEVAAALAQVSEPPIHRSIPTPPLVPPTEPASEAAANVRNQLDRLLATQDRPSSRSSNTGTVLVIPSEQTRIEDIITINEDMTVMSRIFQKNLEQARIPTARGSIFASRHNILGMFMGAGRGQIQSMYLQGYGALFLMKVDFPLSPPPDTQEEQEETKKEQEGDPVWQQMRREIYEPEKVDRRRRTDQPEEKYDAEKVENLKTTLIKALKHVANIRTLKPDESVVLTVAGSYQATNTIITSAKVLPKENQILIQERTTDGNTITKMVTGTSLVGVGLSSPTILVIRTKKSDIDEFAKGDLDLDQFRKRVQLLSYPLLGGADGGNRNPFDDYYRSRSAGSSNIRR